MQINDILGCLSVVMFCFILSTRRSSLISIASVFAFSYLVFGMHLNVSLETDQLTQALNRFQKMRSIDIGDHDHVVKNMKEFIETYKHVLLGHKNFDPNTQIRMLFDLRRDTLNILYGFFVKKGTGKLESNMQGIIADISSSSYRLINILKAKYKVRGSYLPCAYNQSSIHDML